MKTLGLNTFSANLKVRAGDVLGLGNADSGLYMSQTNSSDAIRYFMPSLGDGQSGEPNETSAGLHLPLSARVKS